MNNNAELESSKTNHWLEDSSMTVNLWIIAGDRYREHESTPMNFEIDYSLDKICRNHHCAGCKGCYIKYDN